MKIRILSSPRPTIVAAALAACLTGIVPPAAAQERPLYQRLGGYDAISAVVGDFAERLFADPKLERFFGGMSTDTRKRFKQLNVELVCSATGGPCEYLGRSMPQAHQGSNIRDADFDQVAAHLVATLDKFKVPKKEKDELLAIVGGLRPAIVVAR
jgi:hemoglobin